MTPPINELARKALVDDSRPAWDELFRIVTPRLFGFARRLTDTDADAEDLVQRAWVRVLGATFEPNRDFIAFVFTVAKNLRRDDLRRACRRPGTLSFSGDGPAAEEHTADATLIAEEDAEQVRRCLAHLTETDRRLIVWHFGDGTPHREIAPRLEKTESQVKNLCYRAVGRLLDCLGHVVRPPRKKKSHGRERGAAGDVSSGGGPDPAGKGTHEG